MITLALIVIGMIILFTKTYKSYDDGHDRTKLIMVCILLTTLMSIIPVVIIGGVTGELAVEHKQITTETQIVCLKDTSSINGNVYLFGGQIDGKPCYYYYEKVNNGAFLLKSVSSDKVLIYEQDRNDGVIKKSFDQITPNKYWNFGWFLGVHQYLENEKTEFYIPAGSISRQFILDAE